MSHDDRLPSGEVVWIRTRGWVRTFIRGFGLVLVLLAAFNIFAPVVTGHAPIAPYRDPIVALLSLRAHVYADLLVLLVGLVVTWWG